MASTSNPGTPTLLAELLAEEQDTFVLEHYLSERRVRPKSLELQRQIGCCSTTTNSKNNLSKLLKRSVTYHGPNRASSESPGQFSKIARTFYNKFISFNRVLRLKKSSFWGVSKHDLNHTMHTDEKEAAGTQLERFSSSGSSAIGNTFSESDMDTHSFSSPTNHAIQETAPGRALTQWTSIEENKQHSPVSVLDEIDFIPTVSMYNVRQEEIPSASKIRFQKVSEDSILSASMWELFILSRSDKSKQPMSESLPQYINSKKALQQTRQLLFDCIREVVENKNMKQNRKTGKKQKGLMTGPEEIGKIICNNLETWGKLSADETNIKQLLKFNLISDPEENWSDFEPYRKPIAFEIGDILLEEIINETARDITCSVLADNFQET